MASGGSTDYTIGVEEEYQLVAALDGRLASRARDVLAADWAGELQAEVHETMIEIGTHVCANAAELRSELSRLRLQVASTAASQELRMVAAGVHPFSLWGDQLMSRGERYDKVREHYGRVVRSEQIFGMHVHVAIPSDHDRIPLLVATRWFTPHLLALSCSSPIYESRDTGFASYRSILWRRLPLTGPFPAVRSEEEYTRFRELLVRTGAALDPKTIYWSIRPHPKYPTIEFRIADACPRVEDAVAISALARAMTAAAAERRLSYPSTRMVDTVDVSIISANEWTVARFGLDARIVDPRESSGTVAVRDSIRRLVDEVAPLSEALGDGDALAGIHTILERGNGADRIRQRAPQAKELSELVDWLAGESMLGTGMDRRTEQRERPEDDAAPAPEARS